MCTEPDDKLYFLLRHLGIRRRLGLPEDFLPDGEVAELLGGEVGGDQFTVGAAEVAGASGDVLADVDLAVGVGDFVNEFHGGGVIDSVGSIPNEGKVASRQAHHGYPQFEDGVPSALILQRLNFAEPHTPVSQTCAF